MTAILKHAAFAAAVLAATAYPQSPVEATEGRGILRVETVVSEGRDALWDGARIAVWELEGGRPGQMVARRHATPAKVDLDPGKYRVVVLYQGARSIRDIQVGAGAREKVVLNLNAGEVAFELLPIMGAAPVSEALTWSVHHYVPGKGAGRLVTQTVGDKPTILLSDGWYEVRVDFAGKTVRHVIEARAGERAWYSLIARPSEDY
ncbi:hypothetical protein [Ferruginivarius sediminum]|uniref:Uncharacterized protein n=1 Tax=Ferruginivarius sediminum TaxID=2661937 RepID=A0A369TGF1_9PROT|nr:hypothetical protein [Ferruginivarius sediminum]RDD63684.1 hypothetical protein DRB17_00425 [Ferruginivarius sediminum]